MVLRPLRDLGLSKVIPPGLRRPPPQRARPGLGGECGGLDRYRGGKHAGRDDGDGGGISRQLFGERTYCTLDKKLCTIEEINKCLGISSMENKFIEIALRRFCRSASYFLIFFLIFEVCPSKCFLFYDTIILCVRILKLET